MAKICFVISPIGEEASEARRNADDLFDIVVSPVLKAHGFDVVRADKIPGSGTIGDEIVSLIQSATLCVIDLTGHNANVYYETGRRHETGKPFIQLMQKGERLPFDLAGIRTIFYELSSARDAHAASQELERFVQEFERTGFSNESAGISLGTLATTIERIDRKLDSMRDGSLSWKQSTSGLPPTGGLEALLASPRRALDAAIEAGDLDTIKGLFPRIRRLGSQSYEFLLASQILASQGDDDGLSGLEEILNNSSSSERWQIAVGGVVKYARARNTGAETYHRFRDTIVGIIDDDRSLPDAADRAYVANQLGILSDLAGEHVVSAGFTQRAIDLNPIELAYRANLAVSQEQFDTIEALRTVDSYMTLPRTQLTRFALEEAVDVYIPAGRVEDARAALATLEDLDPAAARAKRREFAKELENERE